MRALLTLIMTVALALQMGLQRGVDPFDASVKTLQRALKPRSDGSEHATMVALRNLRDPALKPLFHKLAGGSSSALQIDAVLGLGELESSPSVDPWLINRLESEGERTLVIKYALNAEMIDPSKIDDMLKWPDLQPLPRILLLAASQMLGNRLDPDVVRPLTSASDDAIAGLSACVLAQAGDPRPLEAIQKRFDSLSGVKRDTTLFDLFRAIEQFKLSACCEFVASEMGRADLDPGVIEAGISAILALKPGMGLEQWNRMLGTKPDQFKLIRFGLLLLNAADRIPPDSFKRLHTGEALNERMAEAGEAFASGKDAGDALFNLIELGHLSTTSWALAFAEKLQSQSASRLYLRLIDRVEGPELGRGIRANLAIDAAARLIEIDPEAIKKKLSTIEDDSLTQEAVLLGLLNARTPRAGDAASVVKRLGAGRADSMALILLARYAGTLSQADISQLGRIAGGGGRVDESLQVQAAWLYLRHANRTEQALNALLAAS